MSHVCALRASVSQRGHRAVVQIRGRGCLNRREVSFLTLKVNPESRQVGAHVAAS